MEVNQYLSGVCCWFFWKSGPGNPTNLFLTDHVKPQKDSGIAEECFVQRRGPGRCEEHMVGSSCLLSGSGQVVLNDKVASDGAFSLCCIH